MICDFMVSLISDAVAVHFKRRHLKLLAAHSETAKSYGGARRGAEFEGDGANWKRLQPQHSRKSLPSA
jgi:hypothetical protein